MLGKPAVAETPILVGETNGSRRHYDRARRRAVAPGPTVWQPMNPISILLLGFAMSTDAFAAAIGKGAAMAKPRLGQAMRVGLIFGVIEAITPVVGWLLGKGASRYIEAWDHWIAFGLQIGRAHV